jgi:hypothetical protein
MMSDGQNVTNPNITQSEFDTSQINGTQLDISIPEHPY